MYACNYSIMGVLHILVFVIALQQTQGMRHLNFVNFAIDYDYSDYYYDYDYKYGYDYSEQKQQFNNNTESIFINNDIAEQSKNSSSLQSPPPPLLSSFPTPSTSQIIFSSAELQKSAQNVVEVDSTFSDTGSGLVSVDYQEMSKSQRFSVSAYAQSCGFRVEDKTCLSSFETAEVYQQIQVAVAAMRVINGQQAYPSRWPYLVSLQLSKGSHNGYQCAAHYCGATLIAPRLLLTAAHCIYSIAQDKRKMGDFRIVGDDTVNGPLLDGIVAQLSPSCRSLPSEKGSSKVIAYYQKMDYTPYRLQNDIAVLVLETPLQIPSQQYTKYWPVSTPATGTRLTVVGWGHTNPEETKAAEQNAIVWMQQGQVWMKSDAQCIADLSVDKLSAYFNPDTMFCAQDQFVDACVGDSGGPIVETKQATNAFDSAVNDVQVGIISWGTPNGCTSTQQGQQDVGIYTNLHPFIDWIDSIALQYAPQKYNLQPPPQRIPPQTTTK